MENEAQNAGAARRPGPATWGLMALVALITLIAVWLVPTGDKNTTPSLPELPPAQNTAQPSQQPAGPDMSATAGPDSAAQELTSTGDSIKLDLPLPPGGVATVTSGGERARAYLYKMRAAGGEPDAQVVFAEAERLQDKGEREDAYLLYRYAARHGDAQAAMKLGTAADPAFHSATNSYLPQPSPGQARKWYVMAAAAGDAEAGKRLDALHVRLEHAADAGDEQAQRLLLQWR